MKELFTVASVSGSKNAYGRYTFVITSAKNGKSYQGEASTVNCPKLGTSITVPFKNDGVNLNFGMVGFEKVTSLAEFILQ